MYDVFRAGVNPGGLTKDYEIKILICYILRKLERPVPVNGLIEMFVGESIGNYFEAANAGSALVESGHLTVAEVEGECCYQLTAIGAEAAEMFENNIPLTIRERAVKAIEHYLTAKSNRAHNHANIRKTQDGYLLTLKITDIGSDLLDITILIPDFDTCEHIRQRFLEDPAVVYKGVVALLTGSFDSVGKLLDSTH